MWIVEMCVKLFHICNYTYAVLEEDYGIEDFFFVISSFHSEKSVFRIFIARLSFSQSKFQIEAETWNFIHSILFRTKDVCRSILKLCFLYSCTMCDCALIKHSCMCWKHVLRWLHFHRCSIFTKAILCVMGFVSFTFWDKPNPCWSIE